MNLQNLNNQLRNNICPLELNYNLDNACIDFNKLQYNSRYHSYEFFGAKFPKGWMSEPLFIPLIESIAESAKANNISPLTELQKLNNIAIINEPNSSEF
jgi:hypothetical protein